MMTIVQLEYLLAIANSGSFSAAAGSCFVTQPSLSMQIKNLEEELGVVLLDRTKKPVVPTEVGKVVIESAREALRAFESVKESVSMMKGEMAGTLRIGIDPTIAPYMTHRFVPEFIRRYPKVDLEVRELHDCDMVDHLRRDKMDVALVTGGMCHEIAVEDELFDDRFFAYVSPNNPLFERANIRIEDINARELLIMTEGHSMRNQVLEMFGGDREARYSLLLEGDSVGSLISIAESTNCIAIIPEMATANIEDCHKNRIKPLSKGAYSRKIVLAARRTYVKLSLIEALKIILPCSSV